jgi:hypothetical protein
MHELQRCGIAKELLLGGKEGDQGGEAGEQQGAVHLGARGCLCHGGGAGVSTEGGLQRAPQEFWVAFAELQASQIAAAKRAAGDKDGEDHREGEGGQYDPKRPLYDAVLAEVNAHAGMLRDEYQKFSTAQFKGQLYEPYGKPLTHGTNERYEYWPSQKSIKPLMYFCAKTLLAGDCNATASCERTHSKTTLITRSLRASMKADTVERLTMGAVYSRQILESMMDSPSKIVSLEQELERQELEEEQAAVQEAGRLAAEAAEAAAAMT